MDESAFRAATHDLDAATAATQTARAEFAAGYARARRLYLACSLTEALAAARELLDLGFGQPGETRAADVADAATLLVRIARRREDYGDALRWADTAITAALVISDAGRECVARAQHARVLSVLGQLDDALNESYAAMKAAARAASAEYEAAALEALGDVHWSMAQWDDALATYTRMLQLTAAGANLDLQAVAHGGLGGVHHHLGEQAARAGDAESARAHFHIAASEADEFARCARAAGDVYVLRTATQNHAVALMALGDTVSARAALEQLLAETIGDDDIAHALLIKNLADVDHTEGRHAEALLRLEAALEAADRLNDLYASMECCDSLTTTCEALSDFVSALRYHKRFHALYERVASQSAQTRARAMAVKYDADTAHAVALAERARADQLENSHSLLSLEASRLQRMSLEDPLTGVGNRRHFDQALLAAAQNTDARRRCSLALIDIDFFKRVNDEHSHSIGDEVLRRIGAILIANSRRGDAASRFGGEEFSMIWADLEPDEAVVACERLRQAIEAENWVVLHPALQVTVSIGLAHLAAGDADTHHLVELADKRLYAAKHQGRNRVVAADGVA